MTRERRMLWGSICQSKKVNKLSLKAALLYTWAIPHFDDEGFQPGEPRDLKINIIPFRDDIPLEEIKKLEIEIIIAGLWKIFHINSTVFIQDPVWNERQSFKGIHKYPSKIKQIIGNTPETVFYVTPQGEYKIKEVKLKIKEVKRSTEEKPFFSSLSENLKSPSKTLDPISRKAELKEQAKFLKEQEKK